MKRVVIVLGFLFVVYSGNEVHAGIVTYTDLNTFLEAAGNVNEIDFETLPDGGPSVFGTLITPEFNYTDQGVGFFSHEPDLFITGNDISGFNLTAGPHGSDGPRNWIITEMVEPATAIGILFPGITSLSIFAVSGTPIGGWTWGGGFSFFGVISDEPIGTAIIDQRDVNSTIDSFYFTPIPEPATLLLLGAGALVLLRRRR